MTLGRNVTFPGFRPTLSLGPWTRFCWYGERARIPIGRHRDPPLDLASSVPACRCVWASPECELVSLVAALRSVRTQSSSG